MRFKMCGVDQESGSELLLYIDTKDEQSARTFASKKRIALAGLWAVEDTDSGVSEPPATERLAGGILGFVKWATIVGVLVTICWLVYEGQSQNGAAEAAKLINSFKDPNQRR